MYLQTAKPMQLDQVKKFYFKDCEGISPFLDRQRSPTAIKADEYLDGPTCVAPPTSGISLCGKPVACKYCNLLWTQKNFDKITWSFKYGERDDNLAPAPGQGKRTDLDKLLEVQTNIANGKWGVKEVYNNVPHLLPKGDAIRYWLSKASSLEQSIMMKPKWNDDPMKDPTMVQILKYINTTQDNRSILWIYSQKGKTGKSTMVTWMANKLKMQGREVFMSSGGKDSDLAHLYDEQCYIIFDLPRSETNIPYALIEQMKNGNVTSTKYQTKAKKPRDRHGNLKFPWVIVVANVGPSRERLSADRCKVICLDSGSQTDAVLPDQEHHMGEQEPAEWNELGPVAPEDLVDFKWENPLNGTGKEHIDKRGPHGLAEEKKYEIKQRTMSTETTGREHKSDDSDSDTEEVVHANPVNRSEAPSPKGLLKKTKTFINKGDSKRAPIQGLGLGGGPPPQSFHTMLTNKINRRKPKPIETKAPPSSPEPWTPVSPNSNHLIVDLTEDDLPPDPFKVKLPSTPWVPKVKVEGSKQPKKTLINKGIKRTRGGGPDEEESATLGTQLIKDEHDGYNDHTAISDDDYTAEELAELEEAYNQAEEHEVIMHQIAENNRLHSAKKQKVKEVTEAEEAAQTMTALIADKKAKALEKLKKKAGIDLQAKED